MGVVILSLACTRGNLMVPPSSPMDTGSDNLRPVVEPSATLAARRHSPTPDMPNPLVATRQASQAYTVRPGDTLGTIADRFGLTVDELIAANGLASPDQLHVGDVLLIPVSTDRPTGPSFKIVPDGELVYGPTAVGLDVVATVARWEGFLTHYVEDVDDETLSGAEIVAFVALRYSINPRLLLAVLEYQTGWVTQAAPSAGWTVYPMGRVEAGREGLYKQLAWAANELNAGYYGWRVGAITFWEFPDGKQVNVDLTINAGTAAVQSLFSDLYNEADWRAVVADGGFNLTYEALFGYPFEDAVEPIMPNDLVQPVLHLPFEPGTAWAFTGGPHGGWDSGSAWAALDFAPPAEFEGCTPSNEWVVAAASGLVVRADDGAVVQDLDADGFEQTGWSLFYMHVESRDRVDLGAWLDVGDRVGHPSCEGGFANGTHLHFARKYNGEWVAADGSIPLILDGWVSAGLGREYDGTLSKDGVSIEACDCRADSNTIFQ